jgi:surfactin synthase thioesterase subunit
MRTSVRQLHVTCLHGQPGAGSDWSAVIDRLPASIGVFAADRPGYGSNTDGPGDFSANARFVLNELDAAGVVLVGHSYGGGIDHGAITCSSSADSAMLANSGDSTPPTHLSMCTLPHPLDQHDAIAQRFCTATSAGH